MLFPCLVSIQIRVVETDPNYRFRLHTTTSFWFQLQSIKIVWAPDVRSRNLLSKTSCKFVFIRRILRCVLQMHGVAYLKCTNPLNVLKHYALHSVKQQGKSTNDPGSRNVKVFCSRSNHLNLLGLRLHIPGSK